MFSNQQQTADKRKIDYGQDAPLLLQRYLLWGGLFATSGGLLLRGTSRRTSRRHSLYFIVGWMLRLVGIASLLRGIIMIWSSRVSKIQAATSLLEALKLQGNETILDLGCGRGLLLLEAARRLPTGKAIGIDLWSQEDQGHNSQQATWQNAEALGVADRVEIHDGDMCDLSFLPDASMDAVVASKALHNIPDRAGRYLALQEATRVLKPGGRIAIMDIFLIDEFAEHLRTCGMQEVRVVTMQSLAYPPLHTVTAIKAPW